MYTKEQKRQIKADIKAMVSEQKENKRNRKTVYFVGDRTMDASTASIKHSSLRYSLHLYYIGYAIMKGKSSEWITQHIDKDFSGTNRHIDTIIKKYGEVVCVGAE